MEETINLQYTTVKDPVPDFIYEGLKNYSSSANSYKPQPTELVEKLTSKYEISKEMLYLTAGCDEAIQMFIHAYGENTFAFTPTYIVYHDAEEFGCKFNPIYSLNENKFDINTDEIKEASLIFLANPNNPSGYTDREKVVSLIKNNKNAIVVIDEAYGEFAPELSVIGEINKFSNLAVFRSFSKAYGMAGNRVGYIMANPDIISFVKNKSQWSNVSYLSIGAAMIALNHEEYYIQMRENIADLREDFMQFLKKEGLSFLPSKINAVVIRFNNENEGTRFFEFLKSNNIITSHGNGFSNIGLDKSSVRIAIGNKKQMDSVKNIISKFKI